MRNVKRQPESAIRNAAATGGCLRLCCLGKCISPWFGLRGVSRFHLARLAYHSERIDVGCRGRRKGQLSLFVFGEHADGAFDELLFLNDVLGVTAVRTNAAPDTCLGIDRWSLDSAHLIDFRFGESIGLELRAIYFERHITHLDRVVSRLFAFEVAQVAVFAILFSQREACSVLTLANPMWTVRLTHMSRG